MNPEFWDGKNVIVTGATGMLGQQIVSRLQGFCKLHALNSRYDLTVKTVALNEFSNRCDSDTVVFHLAGRTSGILDVSRYPADFFYQNLEMGLNVVEASLIHSARKVVFASSVCAYPQNVEMPAREKDIWSGYPEETNAPYGIAKRAVMTMLEAYHEQYSMQYATGILANMYGIGDHFDEENSHVIPSLIRRIVEAKENNNSEFVIWGSGSPTRDFLYVEDAARAMILLAEEGENISANISSGIHVSIKDLAIMLCDLIGYHGRLIYDKSKPDGQLKRSFDIRKITALGWMPEYNIQEGLKKTIESYLSNNK